MRELRNSPSEIRHSRSYWHPRPSAGGPCGRSSTRRVSGRHQSIKTGAYPSYMFLIHVYCLSRLHGAYWAFSGRKCTRICQIHPRTKAKPSSRFLSLRGMVSAFYRARALWPLQPASEHTEITVSRNWCTLYYVF